MKTALLIMAAGIGSRFGTGIKQLEPVDDSNHIIMDYSIHDAIEAGFNHVVFIIRKDIEKEFKEVIGDRIASMCSSHNVTVDYAFQDINDIPGTLPEGRTKPWGTGQAVLAAKKVIKTPFIVINGEILSFENQKQMLIPRGFAHGYLTLEDNTLMQWCVDNDFCAEAARAVRYDSDFAWQTEPWPEGEYIVSEKDQRAERLGSEPKDSKGRAESPLVHAKPNKSNSCVQ